MMGSVVFPVLFPEALDLSHSHVSINSACLFCKVDLPNFFLEWVCLNEERRFLYLFASPEICLMLFFHMIIKTRRQFILVGLQTITCNNKIKCRNIAVRTPTVINYGNTPIKNSPLIAKTLKPSATSNKLKVNLTLWSGGFLLLGSGMKRTVAKLKPLSVKWSITNFSRSCNKRKEKKKKYTSRMLEIENSHNALWTVQNAQKERQS